MLPDLIKCRNCNHAIDTDYCGHCGQPVQVKRVDWHYMLHEIQHVLHFEKGILYTIKELLVKPGHNIREFIADNRSRLVKPIIFIIITSLIYTIIDHFFHIEQGYVSYSNSKVSTAGLIFGWVQNHYGYGNMIMGVYIAFWLKLFFRQYGYNFFEILILLCFVMGMGMLIFAAFAVVEGLTKFGMMKIAGIIGVTYCIWAITQFFNQKKVMNYFKALAAYGLGMITFGLSVMFLGFLIDVLLKY
ncbi:DUF3667 domain-containing protein [Pedobacter psychrodurus]|uniref:DUF3667 domain-containing protein n=1 Tax=Pedobacter psychrodurus TaxID=2530456 RepID=UPI00292D9B15|nr:DUF3667 domain-containing protein [Pedobacter psychrodurus]